jgi:hypothetical protein
MARNPDSSWWNRYTGLKLFWPQPMAPWTKDAWNWIDSAYDRDYWRALVECDIQP